MNSASNKFKTLLKEGKWLAPTDEQAKILALEAKLSKLDRKSTSQTSANSGSSAKKGATSSNSRKSGNSNAKKGKKDIPSWMTKWPGKSFVDANKTKVKDGKTYWWCKKHKRFCMHQTSECRLTSTSGPAGNQSSAAGSSSSTQVAPSNNISTPSICISTTTMMDE